MNLRNGISICMVTYNTFEMTRIVISQIRMLTRLVNYEIMVYDNGSTDGTVEWLNLCDDVYLVRGKNNSKRHGEALDCLVQTADMSITCTLCSDAVPVSPEWMTPAFHINDVTVMAGIQRQTSRKVKECVCPSYLFGRTDWLRNHTFADAWPEYDT